ncbi:hypothetical protein ECP02989422_3182 [Escherichia coli P0298942.2]|nr:hypothetical protein ECP02989421_3541 [Escherichia coli P0298942.1]ENA94285.1 hypothetical protein EC2862600_3373 [Escherichia coli 2862600]ENB38114.1 hypothetical protein ECP029894210_3224 [Escherichia coli P0298942.10]ENB46472.1 hypothetical protein ECP029894211_3402 [Escherichia coli P0298942.11]ENB52758.1 hypothetical protein ECP029894214_3347 [Escherichia coli P0298942.14]ENB59118.1 hypothetical protein ECP029894215_3379 [Escherichia coli P0298942.15]ENB59619.1 hypothetical protein EC
MAVVDDLYSSFFPFKSIGYEYKNAVRTFWPGSPNLPV